MAFWIKGGSVVTSSEVRENTSIGIENGKIVAIGQADPNAEQSVEASGCYVFPGFIDLHVHGGNGADVVDGDTAALDEVCRFHGQHGTTALLLTTRTIPNDQLIRVLSEIRHYQSSVGAAALGIHLEGPFVSHAYRGAQNSEYIQSADVQAMKRWVAASGKQIRLVTLAPELIGVESVIRYLVEEGIIVSAGHSGATYEQMQQAITWGVRHITHCYNGMKGFHHRDPGMLTAAWMNNKVTAELILDGHHSHYAAGQLLLHNKGLDHVALITDAVRAAGLPDGDYESAAGQTVYVEQGVVRLGEGQLAGSSLTMNVAVKNAVEELGLTLLQAAQIASLTPATVLGLQDKKGSICVGKDADLTILDQDFNVKMTIRNGRTVYSDM